MYIPNIKNALHYNKPHLPINAPRRILFQIGERSPILSEDYSAFQNEEIVQRLFHMKIKALYMRLSLVKDLFGRKTTIV